MVDVAAIFDEVFGPDDQDKGLSENGCVRCVGVSGRHKPLENLDNPNTPARDKRHALKQGVLNASTGCAQVTIENQEVTDKDTPTHPTHLKVNNPLQPPDTDAFEERAAIIHDAHTITLADDGAPLPEPIFTLTPEQAETQAAQEQGYADADSIRGESVGRWAAEIERLAKLPAVSPEGVEALKRAQAFIAEGWALQAARLGWDEVELFGVCPRAPWQRLDRKGAAFGGAVQAVTQDAVTYIGGLRRYRATVNNDGGAVLLWELAQDNPSNGGQP
jgi:hypothetical protein